MDFTKQKFRCSALGKIVSKSGKLTDGVKTYLQEVFISEVYGVTKDVNSKYFEKGKYCEEEGITLLNECLYPNNILVKNKERRSNEYIHGEDDTCFKSEIVWDIKNAYDLFTFGKADLSWDYEWQVKGYAWLRKVKKCGLFYCINNMPEHMLQDEERRIFYSGKFFSTEDKEYERLCNEMRARHNYDNMPRWERFKAWEMLFSKEDKERIIESTEIARKYLCELWKVHSEMISENQKRMGLEHSIPPIIKTSI